MIDPEVLPKLTALADPTRLEIIEMLAVSPEPITVDLIAARMRRLQPTISHHLSMMSREKLVKMTVSGRYHLYELHPDSGIVMELELKGEFKGEFKVNTVHFHVQLTKEQPIESKRNHQPTSEDPPLRLTGDGQDSSPTDTR